MKLQKTDDEQEMQMNMTPMIDVVFLLIIFFMVITDLTQQDLEDLQLPTAENAAPDKIDPDEFRPVLNIKQDGSIWARGKCYYDAESPDDYVEIKAYLSDIAKKMDHETFGGEPAARREDGTTIPADALLIRADEYSEFKHTQKVMEQCGYKGISIWKLQLAAAEGEKDEAE